MQRVEVEWEDAHAETGWIAIDDSKSNAADKNALRMLSSGFLIADEEDYVLIALTISIGISDKDDLVNGTMQIPRSAIRRFRYLEEEDIHYELSLEQDSSEK